MTPRRNPLDLQGIHLVSTKFTKGSSITLHCNTTRSVCSNLLLLALRIIPQENTRKLILSRYLVILCEELHIILHPSSPSCNSTQNTLKMAMSTLESGPKLDWTRDNQMFERYRIWKRKVEFIFCSALSDATPKQLVSYLKYWMGDQGIPLIKKWESTGKLDYSNAEETPATEGGRRRILSSGYKLQTYWDLLDEEFKPKGNKLLSIIELWTRCKQGDKALNQWLTHVYNLVNICKYPEDSIDRIIRDVLIIGCNSNNARDKIIRQGEAVTLNQVIEILQTEESTRSTMQQIKEFQGKPVQSVNYVSYDSRSKKSKKPSNEQNSSSTGPTDPKKRKCFRCGEPYNRKHLQECRAQNITCNNCGIKGHLQKCCKKSGNFPKDNSNRENQSSSTGTGTGNMRYVAAVPVEADYFDERGIYKEYRPPVQHTAMQQQIGSMNILRKVHNPNNATILSEDSIEISTSVPTPDFPFTEFPSTEVVTQSQIDSSSISDTLLPRENTNSSISISLPRYRIGTEICAKRLLPQRIERN